METFTFIVELCIYFSHNNLSIWLITLATILVY